MNGGKSDPKFYTKAGRLTPYALACGYVERFELDGHTLELWHEGGPTYHVRHHDHNKHERVFWDSFDTRELTKARKRFDEAKRAILKARAIASVKR